MRNVSFELHAGEVLGLAGLMGSGANEVVEALFGLRKSHADEIVLQGESPGRIQSPAECRSDFRRLGICAE